MILAFLGSEGISDTSGNKIHRCSKHTTFHEMCQWRGCYSKYNRQRKHSFHAVSRAWSSTSKIVNVVTNPMKVNSNLPPPSDKETIIYCAGDGGLWFDAAVFCFLLLSVHASGRSSPDNSRMLFHGSWWLLLLFVFP